MDDAERKPINQFIHPEERSTSNLKFASLASLRKEDGISWWTEMVGAENYSQGIFFREPGGAASEPRMYRPRNERAETIPAKYSTIASPNTHGISMNPMKKVIDPHSIIAKETPSNSQANPAGVICGSGGGGCLLDQEGPAADGAIRESSPDIEIGVGGDRMRLRTTADSSYRNPDCRTSRCPGLILLRVENSARRDRGVGIDGMWPSSRWTHERGSIPTTGGLCVDEDWKPRAGGIVSREVRGGWVKGREGKGGVLVGKSSFF